MRTLTEQDVEVTVYTFKDGIAARLGHDLKLRANRVECRLFPAAEGLFDLEATIDPREVKVVCAQVKGCDDHGLLSASDKSKINGHVQDDVLCTRRHREIVFTSTRVLRDGTGYDVHGNLTLAGVTRPLHVRLLPSGERLLAEVRLDQREFGIKPFAAPLGVLKVKPEVIVEVSVPAALGAG